MNLAVLSTRWEGLRRRPGRSVTTGLSVLLATLVVFSTVLAYRVTTETFLDSFSATTPGASLVAERDDGFTGAEIVRLRGRPEVAQVSGAVSGSLDVAGPGDRSLDVSADPGSGPLSRYAVTRGRYPHRPGEVALSEATARAWSLGPGSSLRLVRSTGDPHVKPTVVPVTVTAVVDSDVLGEAYAPDALAARLVAQEGYSRVDVAGSSPLLGQAVREALGPATVRTGEAVRRAEAKDAVRQFDVVFTGIAVFVLLAVIAATLVASSTFRIVFAQRLRQFALLRVIGGQQRQIGFALAVEGALTGLLAGVLGVAGGFAVVQVAVAVSGGLGHPLASSGFPFLAGVFTVLGAGVLTEVAVLAPALSASDVSPLAAFRSSETGVARARIGVLRWLLAVLTATGAVTLVFVVHNHLPVAGEQYTELQMNLLRIVFSGTLAFVALIAFGPVLVRALLRLVGPVLKRLGTTGELALESLRSSSPRAAVVTVVVALGVTLVTGTVVVAASARALVDSSLATSAPADFGVDGPVSPAGLDSLRHDPALGAVSTYRTFSVRPAGAGDDYVATDLDLGGLPALKALTPAKGSVTGDLAGRVVISDEVSYSLGVGVGDTLRFGRGQSLTVAGVLSGNGPVGSALIVTPEELSSLGAPRRLTGVLVDAAGDLPVADRRIRAIVGPRLSSGVAPLGAVDDPIRSAVAKLFAAALGLVGLTVLIALVGVGTTMSLTVLERTREFGLLRALGLSRTGLRRLIGAESCLYGVLGLMLGLVLGIPYAWLSLLALNLNAPLRLPVVELTAMALLLGAVTPLAGLLTTRRAARVSPMAALGAVS